MYTTAELTALTNRLVKISTTLPKFLKLSKDTLVELHGLPEPSAYAHHLTWRVWQKKETAILNLRPPTNEGLPIEVLHPAFATFVHDVRSIPPGEWALENDVNQVALALCRTMARDFQIERNRRAELMQQLHPLGLGLRIEFHIEQTPPLETHSARPDIYIPYQDTAVLLGEVKSEFESGDPYMQVSRSYQALVHRLESEKRVLDGVPCILLVVCGEYTASQRISRNH